MSISATLPAHWFLEHYLQYIPVNKSPFTIGRGSDQGLNLALEFLDLPLQLLLGRFMGSLGGFRLVRLLG